MMSWDRTWAGMRELMRMKPTVMRTNRPSAPPTRRSRRPGVRRRPWRNGSSARPRNARGGLRLPDRRRGLCRQCAGRAPGRRLGPARPADRPPAAYRRQRLRPLQRGRHSDPSLWAAHLPHQRAADRRLPVAVHALAALRASRAGACRRQAGADPDQPDHDQPALRPDLDAGRRRGASSPAGRSRSTHDPDVRGRGGQPGRAASSTRSSSVATPASNGAWIPRELDKSVTARVPTRTDADDRYFSDSFQSMPLHGYTRMFENMLDHPNIKIMLNTDFDEISHEIVYDRLIFTGPIDEYFDHRFGKLPYRSLRFEHETLDQPQLPARRGRELSRRERALYARHRVQAPDRPAAREDQPDLRVPGGRRRSRITRCRGRRTPSSSASTRSSPTRHRGVHFVGRLATYRYYNMDQVVGQALALYAKLAPTHRRSPGRRTVPAHPCHFGRRRPCRGVAD